MNKEHGWINPDDNSLYDNLVEDIYESYIDTCKSVNIENPIFDLFMIQDIITEVENSYRTLREYAEISDNINPKIIYSLESDEYGDIIVLEVRFGEVSDFDIVLCKYIK